jgi:hypothetical protein
MWNPFNKKNKVEEVTPIIWPSIVFKNETRDNIGLMYVLATPDNYIKLSPEEIEKNKQEERKRRRSIRHRIRMWVQKLFNTDTL